MKIPYALWSENFRGIFSCCDPEIWRQAYGHDTVEGTAIAAFTAINRTTNSITKLWYISYCTLNPCGEIAEEQ